MDDTVLRLVNDALAEDIGSGDITTLYTVTADRDGEGEIVAKAVGVVAGLSVARAVFHRLDPRLTFDALCKDGDGVRTGQVIAHLAGQARAILTAERTALNFLQRLSGIASMTRRFVDEVAGTRAEILDTRKTTPGWRNLEKAAVRFGGGRNHRFGLFDMVLIKENHIAAAGGLEEAVASAREAMAEEFSLEVEVRSIAEFRKALRLGVNRILLDNMGEKDIRQAVRLAQGEVGAATAPLLEASGNITLDNIRAVAECGVDFISVGAITHSAPALDLSLRFRTR